MDEPWSQTMSPRHLLTALLLAQTTTLSGCFLFVEEHVIEDHDPPPPVNHAPEIVEEGTWWLCDWDEVEFDHVFEFQIEVWDPDGDRDVVDAFVTVMLADDPGCVLGEFDLFDEGGGVWGGLVWERESDLFCGEPIDVRYEVYDAYGAGDGMTERY
jgi:hypothetical protein